MSLLMDALKKAEKAKADNESTSAPEEVTEGEGVDVEEQILELDLSTEEHVENSGVEPSTIQPPSPVAVNSPTFQVKKRADTVQEPRQPIPAEHKVSSAEKREQPRFVPPQIIPSQIGKRRSTYYFWTIILALLFISTGLVYYLVTSVLFPKLVVTPVALHQVESKAEMKADGATEAVLQEEGNAENSKAVVSDGVNKSTEEAVKKITAVTVPPPLAPAKSEASKSVSKPVGPQQPAAKYKTVPLVSAKPMEKGIRTTASNTTQRTPLQIQRSQTVSPIERMLNSAYEAYQNGDIDQADRLYRQVLQRNKTNRDAIFGRAIIAQRQNRLQSARALYTNLLNRNPKDSMALIGLMSLSKQDDAQDNVSRLKMLLLEEPEAAHLHFALGNEYAAQERWPEAQHAYFKANRYAVDNADYAYNLAVSLEHIGQPKVALKYYRTALETVSGQNVGFDFQTVSKRIDALSGIEEEQ